MTIKLVINNKDVFFISNARLLYVSRLYILNKRENATPELFAFIYKMMQASNANESASECLKTRPCLTVKVLRMLALGNT